MKLPDLRPLQTAIDGRAFARGLGGVFVLYALIFVWLALNGEQSIQELESRLSSAVVQIEYSGVSLSADQSVRDQGVEDHAEDGLGDQDLLVDETNETSDLQASSPPSLPQQSSAEQPLDKTDETALTPAPIAELVQTSPMGALPKIGDSGLTPFEGYKKAVRFLADTTVIAIALTDYGLSQSVSKGALSALPADITLVLSPYAADAEMFQKEARAAGHEIWLELPFENSEFPMRDPGPLAILAAESLNYNQEKLMSALAVTTGYAGVIARSDERLLSTRLLLQNLLKSIFDRGLGYFEANPEGPLMVEDIAASSDSPYARNNFEIRQDAARQLSLVSDAAKNQGYAAATLQATPENLKALAIHLKTLEADGIKLVPLSYIARPPGAE